MASVLHLGNIHFAADEESNAQVTTENQIKYLSRVSRVCRGRGEGPVGAGVCVPSHMHPLTHPSQLLGVEGATLREALTHRKIIAKGEEVRRSLCPECRVGAAQPCSHPGGLLPGALLYSGGLLPSAQGT